MLYRKTKLKVHTPDGNTDYINIVAGVLQGDTIASHHLIICLDYVLRTSIDKMIENGFKLTKALSRRYPALKITNADYASDIELLAIHTPRPKPCYIIMNDQLQALASMVMHTKKNICALIKEATSLHQTVAL